MTSRTLVWLGGFLGLTLAGFVYIVLIFDPFKWGVVQSEKFTWQDFEKVKIGDRIESVVERLGQPVRPAENFAVLTRDPRDPCVAGGCKKYVFAGAIFGSTFKEAIVNVDSRGNVIYAVARQE